MFEHDLMLSELPLSHAFERTVGYLPIATGTAVAYSRSIPLLAEDLVAVQPTLMISVPRIFERVYGRIMDKLAGESATKRRLFRTAVDRLGTVPPPPGSRPLATVVLIHPLPMSWSLARYRPGWVGACALPCGGAALSSEVARLFIGLGIPVTQGYGLTRRRRLFAANPLDNDPESVGVALPGVEVRVGENDELLTHQSQRHARLLEQPAGHPQRDRQGRLAAHRRQGGDPARRTHPHHRAHQDIIVLANGERCRRRTWKMPLPSMNWSIGTGDRRGRPYLSALLVPNPGAFARVASELHLDPANRETCCDEERCGRCSCATSSSASAFPGYAQVRGWP